MPTGGQLGEWMCSTELKWVRQGYRSGTHSPLIVRHCSDISSNFAATVINGAPLKILVCFPSLVRNNKMRSEFQTFYHFTFKYSKRTVSHSYVIHIMLFSLPTASIIPSVESKSVVRPKFAILVGLVLFHYAVLLTKHETIKIYWMKGQPIRTQEQPHNFGVEGSNWTRHKANQKWIHLTVLNERGADFSLTRETLEGQPRPTVRVTWQSSQT